jgi:integrase
MLRALKSNHIPDYFELKAESTARAYRSDIRDFTRTTHKPLEQAEPLDIVNWVISMHRRRLADATIRRRYHAARAVLGFLVDLEQIPRNPCAAAGRAISWRQAKQIRPTKLLRPSEVVHIFAAARRLESEPTLRARALAMLALMFGGGLRRSEVRALNVADIGGSYVVLRGTKAGIEQVQELPPWAAKQVSQLCRRRRREKGIALFCFYYADGRPGKRLSDSSIYRLFKRYCAAAGIKAAPHAARASAVTQLKRMGCEDRAVADYLRHKTTKQVTIYDKRARSERCGAGKRLSYGKISAQD